MRETAQVVGPPHCATVRVCRFMPSPVSSPVSTPSAFHILAARSDAAISSSQSRGLTLVCAEHSAGRKPRNRRVGCAYHIVLSGQSGGLSVDKARVHRLFLSAVFKNSSPFSRAAIALLAVSSAGTRLEFRTVSWRVEVRPLACGHLERAHHLFVDRNEAQRMRLRMGRRDFSGAGLQLLKPARNRSCQWRLPSIANEPPGDALSRHAPFPLLPASRERTLSACRIRSGARPSAPFPGAPAGF